MKSLKELLADRAGLVKQGRELLDKASAEKRELSAEEALQYDKIDADIENLGKQIDAKNADTDRRDRLAKHEDRLRDSAERQTEASSPGGKHHKISKRGTDQYQEMFGRYLSNSPLAEQEMLALQSDDSERGGYITASEQFVLELIKELDDEVVIRGMARTFTVTDAGSMSVPVRKAKASTFAWSSEIAEPVADTSLKFGKRKLEPHYLSGEIEVSRDLLRRALLPADSIVREELARDAGELQESAFLYGDGNQKPLGVFVNSADGISATRDVAGTNTTTAITADTVLDMVYSLKAAYARKSEWLLHRLILKSIRKLKTDDKQYLWQPGLQAGEPETLAGRPIRQSEFAPYTQTAGQYVAMLADWSNYWIVDGLDYEIQALFELEARRNMAVYLCRAKVDGMPIREEAFARMKMAAE